MTQKSIGKDDNEILPTEGKKSRLAQFTNLYYMLIVLFKKKYTKSAGFNKEWMEKKDREINFGAFKNGNHR